jgi:glycosyltransferase involved in cell wall biosynthesis
MPEFGPSELAIVIPTRNRWDILRRTLDALRAQSVSGFETIVVADGTDQNPPADPGVRTLVKEHGGPGAARNAGVAATQRPLILFLGDDMVPKAELVARHLAVHERHPDNRTAVLGHIDPHPEAAGRINRWMDWSGTQFDYHGIEGDVAGFGRFYSSNISLKRELFNEVHGFDEDFVYYYEDLDMGWRLDQAGMVLLYERDAIAHHLHRLRWPDVLRRFQGIAPGERMMAKKHDWFEPWFARRARASASRRPVSGIWPLSVELVPRNLTAVRSVAERRADTWYYQHLAPYFFDAWEGDRDLEELKEYLGDSFDVERLRGHMHEVMHELEVVGDEATFYRKSEAYLYDLTVFAMSATKVPYREVLRKLVPRGGRLLDWGCGIGSDGLRLIEDGYDVSFADFDNPSTKYLRWRLAQRGHDATVYDLDADNIPGGFDAAYCFDVLEHVEDPIATLEALESRAQLIFVNLVSSEEDDHHPHHALPIAKVLTRASHSGLLHYRRYYGGRVHLIAYRGSSGGAGGARKPSRLNSVIARHLGRFLPPIG